MDDEKQWDGVDRRTRSRHTTSTEELNDWQTGITLWQAAVDRKQSFTLFTVGVVVLILSIGFVITFSANRSIQDAQTQQALDRTKANIELVQDIQDERRETLVRFCRETNKKNREAYRRAQIRISSLQSRKLTFGLINDLAPYTDDCKAFADSRVRAR